MTQAAVLIISATSARDVSPKDWVRVLKKEMLVVLGLSAVLGTVTGVMGYIRGHTVELALVLLISMVSVSLVANVLGTLLPFMMLWMKQDPAVSSTPLITTVIDVLGITIYMAFAQIILKDL